MEEKLAKILKSGHLITPSEDLKERGKRLFFANQTKPSFTSLIKNEILANFKFSLALVTGALMMLVIFGGINYWQTLASKQNAAPNETDLAHEAQKLDFQIVIGQAEYLDDSAQTIAAVLQEIKKSH